MSAVMVERTAEDTRVVLESAAPIRFTLLTLSNPDRLILDLESVAADDVLRQIGAKLDHDSQVKVEAITQRPSGARIAMSLAGGADPEIFIVKGGPARPHRLILDIHTPRAAAEAIRVERAPAEEEMLLAVQFRGESRTEPTLALRRADGKLLLRRVDLQRWRLRLPESAPVLHENEPYLPLDSLAGLSYSLDAASQMLTLDVPPALFTETIFRANDKGGVVPLPAPPGAFANYDISLERDRGSVNATGLVELGAFGPWGYGTSTFVAQRRDGLDVRRLDTRWTRDDPASLTSMRLGDVVTAAGAWGRGLRVGGLQWSSDFAMQPDMTTFPTPGLAGEAVIPSTVELYVNDALRLNRSVPAGPFSIQDLPVVSGQGEARLVVRDALGRERVVTQPYYASPRLLRPGLHEFSYEVGFVREAYGLTSSDYGRPVAAATHRVGIDNRFTVEGRVELSREQQALGASAAYLLPLWGVVNASAAASRSARGAGHLLSLGVEHNARRLSFGADAQLASAPFAQLGWELDRPAPRVSAHAYASWAGDGMGSVGVAYAQQSYRDAPDVRIASATYGVTLAWGYLSLSALRMFAPQAATLWTLNFTYAIDARTSAGAAATLRPGRDQVSARLQRNLPAGDGFGYRIGASQADIGRWDAAVSAQNSVGIYQLEAARSAGDTGVRANIAGGAGLIEGHVFASRPITESFASVTVPDYPGVRVYADNQVVARTGRDGTALVPRLRAYEKNNIRIEQADLPLDAQIDATQVDAVPYARSGVAIVFPVRRSHGALIVVNLEDGEAVPAGAIARIAGDNKDFPSGRHGEFYLSGLAPSNRVTIHWRGASCAIDVAVPVTDDPLPRLGPFACVGVTR